MALLKTKKGESVGELIARLKQDPNVEYAEPNYLYEPASIDTNDTYRALLWALDNTGQSVNGTIGTADADMDAPQAWALSEGSTSTIVAVIDVGVAYNHPDLAANMWDGTDCKDENGDFLGGCAHGYDYVNNTKTPVPDNNGHGTILSGIIAATKNNGMGVAGLAPKARIMAFSTGYSDYNIIKAINFAMQNGAKIINASYGGVSFSQAHYEAVKKFVASGGILVAAAHNYGRNNDLTPIYPASFNIDGVIAVAATDQNDNLASFSDFGTSSVDVAAPGVNIFSTACSSNCSSQSYGYMSGTSASTPQVAALAALIMGTDPSISSLGVKNIILSTGDAIPILSNKLLTGRRVNAYNAINQLSSLTNYTPQAGYLSDGVIPAADIDYSSRTGLVTAHFKVKDSFSGLSEFLSDFSYSTDDGATWQTPANGDSSKSLSADWQSNNYISRTDYTGLTYSFTFNSRHEDASGINATSSVIAKIRFKVSDGINKSGYIESEAFSVYKVIQTLSIAQPANAVSIDASSYEIKGTTNPGSLVEIYRGAVLATSSQLASDQSSFDITVSLNQDDLNYFTVQSTEPVNNTTQSAILPVIREGNALYKWTRRDNAGTRFWRSIASSRDGQKLFAAPVSSYIYASSDSGITWTAKTNSGSRVWESISSSADGQKLAAVEYYGYIYISDDGGDTWAAASGAGYRDWRSIASSLDGQKLVAVAYSNYIYTSTDGGSTWIARSGAGARGWGTVTSSGDGEKLAATANNDHIYTSSDGGANWEDRNVAGSQTWEALASSLDGENLAASASSVSNLIYISHNAGEAWSISPVAGEAALNSLAFSGDGQRLIAGDYFDGYTYLSNDSGLSWNEQSDLGSGNWYPVSLSVNGNVAIAAAAGNGNNGYLYTYYYSSPPTLSTQAASNLNLTSATLSGRITDTGGANVTARGFQYGLTDSYSATTTEAGSFSSGDYSASLSDLTCSTTYHYRAFATNSAGTGYGEDGTFRTSECLPVNSGGGTSYIPFTSVSTVALSSTTSAVNIATPAKADPLAVFAGNKSIGAIPLDHNLQFGATNPNVRVLQRFLNDKGYIVAKNGSGSRGQETNFFGLGTKNALIKFQKKNHISPANGMLGPQTRKMINAMIKNRK